MAASDAADRGLGEGDLLEISTPARPGRGAAAGQRHPARAWCSCRSTTATGTRRRITATGRAANELTVTDWDPVSKQPLFKTAAAAVRRLAEAAGTPSPAPTTTASAPAVGSPPPTTGGRAAEAVELIGGRA